METTVLVLFSDESSVSVSSRSSVGAAVALEIAAFAASAAVSAFSTSFSKQQSSPSCALPVSNSSKSSPFVRTGVAKDDSKPPTPPKPIGVFGATAFGAFVSSSSSSSSNACAVPSVVSVFGCDSSFFPSVFGGCSSSSRKSPVKGAAKGEERVACVVQGNAGAVGVEGGVGFSLSHTALSVLACCDDTRGVA